RFLFGFSARSPERHLSTSWRILALWVETPQPRAAGLTPNRHLRRENQPHDERPDGSCLRTTGRLASRGTRRSAFGVLQATIDSSSPSPLSSSRRTSWGSNL